MPRFVNFWIPLALSFLTASLAACSTTPAKPIVETVQVYVIPPKQLRVACTPPLTVESKSTRDIRDNSLARKSAYEQCALRMANLLGWLDEAEKLQATNSEKQAASK